MQWVIRGKGQKKGRCLQTFKNIYITTRPAERRKRFKTMGQSVHTYFSNTFREYLVIPRNVNKLKWHITHWGLCSFLLSGLAIVCQHWRDSLVIYQWSSCLCNLWMPDDKTMAILIKSTVWVSLTNWRGVGWSWGWRNGRIICFFIHSCRSNKIKRKAIKIIIEETKLF